MADWLKILKNYIDTLETIIGTATDNADLATLFAKARQQFLGTHTHALVVVNDASSLNADLDTALKDWAVRLFWGQIVLFAFSGTATIAATVIGIARKWYN